MWMVDFVGRKAGETLREIEVRMCIMQRLHPLNTQNNKTSSQRNSSYVGPIFFPRHMPTSAKGSETHGYGAFRASTALFLYPFLTRDHVADIHPSASAYPKWLG